jgi:hypothetical protein
MVGLVSVLAAAAAACKAKPLSSSFLFSSLLFSFRVLQLGFERWID